MATVQRWLARSWWHYSPTTPDGFAKIYHWFNLAEGFAWCLIALLVLLRFIKRRNSRLEVLYALAFVAFGLSDFLESRELATWLILAKGVNLAVLFGLRSYLLRRYYPESKTY
jgi:hypothetical protein